MKKGIILLGSSNSNGETFMAAEYLHNHTNYTLIDLKTKNIKPFDYEFNNQTDDFIPLIKEIVTSYEIIIFATPVYWYTMSGTMKVFFDRISDCLKIEKETGSSIADPGRGSSKKRNRVVANTTRLHFRPSEGRRADQSR